MRPSRRHLFGLVSGLLALALLLFWGFPEEGQRLAHAKTDRTGLYDLARARMLARVIGYIRADYVEPERVDVKRMAVGALERMQADIPEVRMRVSPEQRGPNAVRRPPEVLSVSVGDITREFTLDKVKDLYELNWKMMDIFEFLERHLPPTVDLEAVEYTAINGMLSTLDPHSVLMHPRVYRELQLSQKGRFGGLGISVGDVEGSLVVQQVLPNTPASEGGLEVDDRIVQIGGVSTTGMRLDEAINLLRGEPGSEVTLAIVRPGGKESRQVKLVRREIQFPAVEEQSLGRGIGWVHIRSFQPATTDEDLLAALERLERAPGGLEGLILDLRDNPGGLLEKAIRVSDMFLRSGTVVTTVREGGRNRKETHATAADTRERLPLVVLVNRGSASASEIVAGALKRNDRALILGQRTFGKGSVQDVQKIDEAGLKLTVAQYLTPGDISIQGVGIVPDIELVALRVPEARVGSANEGRLDLNPATSDKGGEAALDAHLSSDRTRDERPSVTLRVLEDSKTQTHRQRHGEPRVADATVKLARDILLEGRSSERKQALVQLAGFFTRRQIEEDAHIAAALNPQGVDWRAVDPPSRVDAELILKMPDKVEAGESFEVSIELKNRSRRPLGRLHAELESNFSGIDGREVAFGYVDAQRTVTKTLRLSVPSGGLWGADRVIARLYADGQPIDISTGRDLGVRPRPLPVFAHSLQIVDPAGNGDGLLQRGERVEVVVWVENVGEGSADDVQVSLRNDSGPDVQIHRGRVELGSVGRGVTKRASFELELKSQMSARLVELELDVQDASRTTVSSSRSLEIAISPPSDSLTSKQPESRLAVFPNVTTAVHAGAHRDSPTIATARAGAVVRSIAVRDGWLEVEWNGGGLPRTGWVPAERVRFASDGGVSKDGITAIFQYRPPLVSLSEIFPFNSGPDLPLQGVARFSEHGTNRRLIYIFRARDKVFFRSLESSRPEESQAAEFPFQASIPLEVGPNEITVVVREGRESVTRTTFSVVRRQ
jgi:carboxyl-terminal processing protease